MKKQRHNHITLALELIAVILAAVLMLGIGAPAFAAEGNEGEQNSEPIMVSLGDSYSAGEGIEPYYYSRNADRYQQPDWLAHRSRFSWPGRLKLTDSNGQRLIMWQNKAFYNEKTKSYASYNKNNWYFVASSGAVTGSLRGTQNKSFDCYIETGSFEDGGSVTLDSQLKVFESIEPGTTDYVTMTMGGNDAHFADVFVYAAFNCSFININGMDDYLGSIWDEFYNGSNSIKNRLIRAYRDIHSAAGNQANIIIAGYPRILPEDGYVIFSASESRVIDNAITKLNQEIKGIVQSLNSDDFKIYFVSVEDAFEGHEVYTGRNSYINGIEFVRMQDLAHSQIISSSSIHPNKSGSLAYASCVQKCIDRIEKQNEQNTSIQSTEKIAEVEDVSVEQTPLLEPSEEPADEAAQEQKRRELSKTGDINKDGCISILDVAELISSEDYGSAVSAEHRAEDLNADGVISERDVLIMVRLDIYETKTQN